jgi:hypothetical protein
MRVAYPCTQKLRFTVFFSLLVVLVGLLIWAGTISPDPTMNNYPDNDDLGGEYNAYYGSQVILGGTVVETEPVIVKVVPDTAPPSRVTFENVDNSVYRGDEISAFGTLHDGPTLDVERSITRKTWERYYMYLISFIGGIWVFIRLLQYWRIEADGFAFIPGDEY